MAGEFSTVGATNALAGALGSATQTARTVYLALLTATPTDATTNATMTEYGATGYARQTCAFAAPTAADPPVSANSALLTFGPFTAGTGSTVTHCAVVSSSSGTGGDFIAWWSLAASKTPATGESITVAIGALTLSCD